MQEQLDRVRAGEVDPPCAACGGSNARRRSRSARHRGGRPGAPFEAAGDCDLFLAIGTSLTVTPASLLCGVAQGSGASCMIINADPTVYDESADAVVHAPIGEVLPSIVGSALSGGGPA